MPLFFLRDRAGHTRGLRDELRYLVLILALTLGAGYPAVAGVGDFNGDGYQDLLWTNNGTATLWYLGAGGTTQLNSAYLGGQGYPWTLAAAGDFDRNGTPDLVWYNNSTAQVLAWYMGGTGGTTLQSTAYLDPWGEPGWHVVAVADFNGDGVPDLVWQNYSTRQVTVWYMGGPNGATVQGWTYLDPAGQPGSGIGLQKDEHRSV